MNSFNFFVFLNFFEYKSHKLFYFNATQPSLILILYYYYNNNGIILQKKKKIVTEDRKMKRSKIV